MILRIPDYCADFKCSAGKCSDSCCIGWEIDIDSKTADYYMFVEGEFGDKLRRSISCGDEYSFILQNERCPFLNEDNLCEIILTLGEDKLCHICSEHPRFYEWFCGVKEGGIGLCCEEGARLILEKGLSEGYIEHEIPHEDCDEYDAELYHCLFEAREKILALLRDENEDLSSAASRILDYSHIIQERIDNYEYDSVPEMAAVSDNEKKTPDVTAVLDLLYNLEPIDENWKPFIKELRERADGYLRSCKYDRYLRSVGIYFIWRYFMKGVADGEILSKVKLAVISVAVLSVIFEITDADFEKCVILAKNYSKEIEYSAENLDAIYDMTYTADVFSSESLKAFLNEKPL